MTLLKARQEQGKQVLALTNHKIIRQCIFISAVIASTLVSRAESVVPSAAASVRQEVWRAVSVELQLGGGAESRLPAGEDFDLPVDPAALAGKTLRAVSACWDEVMKRAKIRVECNEAGQCLPFLVYLSARAVGDGGRIGACGLKVRSAVRGPEKPTVSVGDAAIAVFHAERLRMTASVTCLDRGREGEVIRVRGADGHVFRARISGAGLVEALAQ